jgi:membrane associated rhomboid family serine protease
MSGDYPFQVSFSMASLFLFISFEALFMNTPTPWITVLVIAATVFSSYRAFGSPALHNRLAFSTVAILDQGDWTRIVTSGFVHGGWGHLLFNMFSFWSFGQYLELVYGPFSLLLIYFGSMVGGNLISLLIHRRFEYRAVGASGGVCGVIYASIFLLPGGGVRIFLIPIDIPTWLFAILFIVGSTFAMQVGRDNIGHDAHLAGALVGVAITTILYPAIIPANPLLYGAVVILSFGALWWAVKGTYQ